MKRKWMRIISITVTVAALLAPAGARALANQMITPNGTSSDSMDALAREGRFTILLRAITAAGLTQMLRGKGPFTLFAPNDAAFNKVPKAELDSLLKNPAKLKQLVLYHTAAQRVSFKGMKQGDSTSLTLRMLDGSQVGIQCDIAHTHHWFGTDKAAEIVRSDIVAGNGLIQEIDAVAQGGSDEWRASVAAAAGGGGVGRDSGIAAAAGGGGSGRDAGIAAAAGGAGNGHNGGKTAAAGGDGTGSRDKTAPNQSGSLIDTLNRAGDFRILVALLNKAGLTSFLQDPQRSFTLFAPDDKAFSTLKKETLNGLLSDPRAARSWILPYIVSGRLTTRELANPQLGGAPLPTLAGRPGAIRRQAGLLIYEAPAASEAQSERTIGPAALPGSARIISADHLASNGVFHVIAWGDGAPSR